MILSFSSLVILCFLFSTTSFAQNLDKGTILAAGGINFSSQSNTAEANGNEIDLGSTPTFQFIPSVGYFITDYVVAGASLSYLSENFDSDLDDSESTTTAFLFQPFGRYYLDNGLFGQASIGFGTGTSEFESSFGSDEDDVDLFTWGVGIGYAAFVSEGISIEPLVSYGAVRSTFDALGTEVQETDRGLTIGVTLGVYIN